MPAGTPCLRALRAYGHPVPAGTLRLRALLCLRARCAYGRLRLRALVRMGTYNERCRCGALKQDHRTILEVKFLSAAKVSFHCSPFCSRFGSLFTASTNGEAVEAKA